MAGEQRPGAGEPTEPPTPRRLQDARRRGEVARSLDIVSTSVFWVGMGALALLAPWMIGRLARFMRWALMAAAAPETGPRAAVALAGQLAATLTLPVLGSVVLAALVAGYLQVGALFTLQPLKPRLGRLDPLEHLKQVFGTRSLVELGKSLVKIVGVGGAAASAVWDFAPEIARTALRQPEDALVVGGRCVLAAAWRVGVVAAVLAVADLLYQRWSFHRRLMMSKQEVKREQKEGEGDPQHKAERQRIHREILQQHMFERTSKADCVIINPEHVAVAIVYDRACMSAPQVVARGRGLVAAKIRQIARQQGIPLIRNVPLARALVELELDEEVPGDLYQAVAEVLRFVYRLSEEQRKRREKPQERSGPPVGGLRA